MINATVTREKKSSWQTTNGRSRDIPVISSLPNIDLYKVGSLFSGMGGMLGGAVNAGFKPAWANDIDPACCTTLTHRFPNLRVLEKPIQDVSVAKDDLEPVDLLFAGFPCQSFSVGGRRQGFEDARGAAVFHLIRLLNEWGNERPAVMILENVPNLKHGNNGEWMGRIAHEIRMAGYWFKESYNTQILNTAKLTGVPQDRDRLFMVACSTERFNANLFTFPQQRAHVKPINSYIKRGHKGPESAYMDPSNRFTNMIIDDMESTGDFDAIYQIRRYYARSKKGGLCPTLTANMGGGGHNVPFIKDKWGIRQLTVEECATLQGFDKPKSMFPSGLPDTVKYRMIGNAVSQPVAEKLALEARRVIEVKDLQHAK